jgi:hypothetical protein
MEQNAGSNGESELEPQRCVLKVGGGLLISFDLRGWRVLFKYFRLNCSAWKKVDVTMVYCVSKWWTFQECFSFRNYITHLKRASVVEMTIFQVKGFDCGTKRLNFMEFKIFW